MRQENVELQWNSESSHPKATLCNVVCSIWSRWALQEIFQTEIFIHFLTPTRVVIDLTEQRGSEHNQPFSLDFERCACQKGFNFLEGLMQSKLLCNPLFAIMTSHSETVCCHLSVYSSEDGLDKCDGLQHMHHVAIYLCISILLWFPPRDTRWEVKLFCDSVITAEILLPN